MRNYNYLLAALLILPLTAFAQKGGPVAILEARIAQLEAQVADLQNLLNGVSRGTDPISLQDTLQFSGMDVQIVNGLDDTQTSNGTGNLIIGYNETRDVFGSCGTPGPFFNLCDRRYGSHNLVIGSRNNYYEHGGIVVGDLQTTVGVFSSVVGGSGNSTLGDFSTVIGGLANATIGTYSSIIGGEFNRTEETGVGATITGGVSKSASTANCVVGDDGIDC